MKLKTRQITVTAILLAICIDDRACDVYIQVFEKLAYNADCE